jgi:hypothetical protein
MHFPFDHSPTNMEVNGLQLSIRKMVAWIITFCPTNTGCGWELQKLHDQLHIIMDLIYFHHCLIWDAGISE